MSTLPQAKEKGEDISDVELGEVLCVIAYSLHFNVPLLLFLLPFRLALVALLPMLFTASLSDLRVVPNVETL